LAKQELNKKNLDSLKSSLSWWQENSFSERTNGLIYLFDHATKDWNFVGAGQSFVQQAISIAACEVAK
jgi:hypothetical protein